MPLGVFGVWWNRHAVARVGWPSLRALGPLFVVLLMQIHYLVFMIPKLGPSNDVDLFFSVYFTLAFVVGLVLDTRLTDESKAVSTRYLILSAAAGGSIPALLFNLLAG